MIEREVSSASLERFRAFLTRAAALSLEQDEQTGPTEQAGPDLEQFRQFVARARPLVTERARVYVREFAPVAACVERWLVDVDLLDIADCSMDEDRYTELLAWALSQTVEPRAALACQNALFDAAGLHIRVDHPMKVDPQLPTFEGVVPDLVLHDDRHLVVVEAKTNSKEHVAGQTGGMQTVVYADIARRSLGLRAAVVDHTVFLTAGGDEPASPKAHAVTYARLAMGFARSLEPEGMPPDVNFVYATIITHWLEQTSWAGRAVRQACRDAQGWLGASDAALLRDLDTIHQLQEAWPLGETDQ